MSVERDRGEREGSRFLELHPGALAGLVRQMFEHHPLPLWVADQDTLELIDANPAAVALYGFERDELLRMRISDIRPLEDLPPLVKASRALEPGWHSQGTWRHLRKGGHVLEVEVSTYPLEHPTRRLFLVQARPLGEAAGPPPATAPRPLDQALALTPAIVFRIDRSGIIRLSVGKGLDGLGLTQNEIAGRSVYDLYREDAQVLHHVNRTLAGEIVSTVIAVTRGPGVGRYFDTQFIPERDEHGNVAGVLGIAIDVTERKVAEAERSQLLVRERAARAEAEEARWRADFLSESSRMLASSLDYPTTLASIARLAIPHIADWCVVDLVEDAGIRRVALSHVDPQQAERGQRLLRTYDAVGPEPGRGVRAVLRESRSAVLSDGADVSHLALSGEEAELETLRGLGMSGATIVPLVARWRTLGAIAFVSASPRRGVQAELGLAEDLAQRCALAIDNARLFRQAQAAIEARDEFLSVASHELRTPLTSLLLQVQFVLDAVRDGSAMEPGSLATMLMKAEHHIQRLSKLIGSLLDVSRVDAGRFELELEEVALAPLVRDVASRFSRERERAGCELGLELDERLVATCDRIRVEQIVSNLLGNALKHARGRPIAVVLERRDRRVALVVRDQGIGIAPADHDRIFERFHRSVPGGAPGGLGLGLYIVKQIVTAHGGSIRVDSQLDRGATFTVTLPLGTP